MGVPGSGKSLQGRMLADELGLPWLSTGEFLRMLVSGAQRKEMVAGKLLDDQHIIALMQKILGLIDAHQQFVLDGFPRSIAQADWLLSQMKHGQLSPATVIHLKASPEVVSQRLLGRGRPDDAASVIAKRFQEYEQSTTPILEHFKQAGVPVLDIEGEGDVQTIHQTIMEALKS